LWNVFPTKTHGSNTALQREMDTLLVQCIITDKYCLIISW
jgi:hypothetical protein